MAIHIAFKVILRPMAIETHPYIVIWRHINFVFGSCAQCGNSDIWYDLLLRRLGCHCSTLIFAISYLYPFVIGVFAFLSLDLVTLAAKITHNDKTFHQKISWSFANIMIVPSPWQFLTVDWYRMSLQNWFCLCFFSHFKLFYICELLLHCGSSFRLWYFSRSFGRTSLADHWPFMMKSNTLLYVLLWSHLDSLLDKHRSGACELRGCLEVTFASFLIA